MNPFGIIVEQTPEWWAISETEDLRTGLGVSVDLATVPYKALRTPVAVKDLGTALDRAVNVEYAEAGIGVAEVIIGTTTVKQLESFGFGSDTFNNAAGVAASNAGVFILEQDCLECD